LSPEQRHAFSWCSSGQLFHLKANNHRVCRLRVPLKVHYPIIFFLLFQTNKQYSLLNQQTFGFFVCVCVCSKWILNRSYIIHDFRNSHVFIPFQFLLLIFINDEPEVSSVYLLLSLACYLYSSIGTTLAYDVLTADGARPPYIHT
jgi:hypothetical protein